MFGPVLVNVIVQIRTGRAGRLKCMEAITCTSFTPLRKGSFWFSNFIGGLEGS